MASFYQGAKPMLRTMAIYGVFVTTLGLMGYVASGQASKTALIPCVFGLPMIALAIALWLKPSVTKQLTVAGAIIALLAALGTMGGLPGTFTLLTGGEVARPAAVISKAVMAIASLIYLGLYGQYLLQARNHRAQDNLPE